MLNVPSFGGRKTTSSSSVLQFYRRKRRTDANDDDAWEPWVCVYCLWSEIKMRPGGLHATELKFDAFAVLWVSTILLLLTKQSMREAEKMRATTAKQSVRKDCIINVMSMRRPAGTRRTCMCESSGWNMRVHLANMLYDSDLRVKERSFGWQVLQKFSCRNSAAKFCKSNQIKELKNSESVSSNWQIAAVASILW